MNIQIIQERFDTYHCVSKQDVANALKEIVQEIALAALSRSGFFKNAAFQGGTCLRILHGINRFSEDLDFILKEPDPHFIWDPCLQQMTQEFLAFGIEAEFQDRSKMDNAVKKFFLKDTSLGKLLNVSFGDPTQKIKIKFELDTNPPVGSDFEIKYLDFPFPFVVTTQDLPSLFAGKSHALLCREYTKGRDWYDLLWYVARKIKPNFTFLQNALIQNGAWEGQDIQVTPSWYLLEMKKMIQSIDWADAKTDIMRFAKGSERQSLDLWSQDFFLDRLEKMESYLSDNTP